MQDLPTAMDADKLEPLLGLRDLGSMRQWHLQPTCAVTGDGLHEGMEKLQEMINNRRKTSRDDIQCCREISQHVSKKLQ